MVDKFVDIILPHGFCNDDGSQIHNIKMRSINGYDEEFVYQIYHKYPTLQKTTLLLDNLLIFNKEAENSINTHNKKNIDKKEIHNKNKPSIAKRLAIGDRVYIILKLREEMFGNNISCTVSCPSCHDLFSLDLFISELSK